MRARLLLLLLILTAPSVYGQLALRHYDEDNQPHLVTKVRPETFHYGFADDKVVEIRHSRTRLTLYPHYFPGTIRIEKHKATHLTRSDSSLNISESYALKINLVITPNRDFEEAYLVFKWIDSRNGTLNLACPIGDLYAGRTRKLNYSLEVPNRYAEAVYHMHFMCGGVEVFSSQHNAEMPHPVQEFAADNEFTPPENAGPRPFVVISPNPPVSGSAPQGSSVVKVKVAIDENGYVVDATVTDSPDAGMSERALEAIQLWKWLPRYKEGKAVPASVVVPFKF